MRDILMVALLTGARREEIFSWTCADYQTDLLKVRKSKTRAGRRSIPVHSLLKPILDRRTEGRGSDEFIFASVKQHRMSTKVRPRGDAFGKRFVKYRRLVGVEDQDVTRRRSRVDFHSCRRWFAEQCEMLGHQENFVARLLGHQLPGMSFGRYSKPKEQESFLAKLREIVDSVKLPSSQP
jgi:integrase